MNKTKTMLAAVIEKTGAPEALEIRELACPDVAPEQVLIAPHFASVNPIDCYLRSGSVTQPLPFPYIVGCDMAGVVLSTGKDVTRFREGDVVWCPAEGFGGRQGITAQQVVVEEARVQHGGEGADLRQLAACGLVGLTAHLGLFARGGLQANETVFVRGGSGGVGSMVIQMAVAAGARVIASAGSSEKVQGCLDHGALAAFNYRESDSRETVAALAPQGIDLFWDTTREPDLELAGNLLCERGRVILMAGREAYPCLPVGLFYSRQLSLHGLMVFQALPDETQRAAVDMQRWIAEGKLRSTISGTFPLAQIHEAHALQEGSTLRHEGGVHGKLLIDLQG